MNRSTEMIEAMTPPFALLRVGSEAADEWVGRPRDDGARKRPSRLRRILRSRWLAWSVALVVSLSAVGLAALSLGDHARSVHQLNARLGAARTELSSASQAAAVANLKAAGLQDRVSALQKQLAELRASKIKTVVKTETVTKTVIRWVPNARGVGVETTGFEGMIAIRDVQLTHSYGYSDLIGIAVNKSGQAISYAQLGCTFVDANGRVIANAIDNKQSWQPGQTWGFDCSAPVNAAGGILRVDELS